jgi:hypothetical protein
MTVARRCAALNVKSRIIPSSATFHCNSNIEMTPSAKLT